MYQRVTVTHPLYFSNWYDERLSVQVKILSHCLPELCVETVCSLDIKELARQTGIVWHKHKIRFSYVISDVLQEDNGNVFTSNTLIMNQDKDLDYENKEVWQALKTYTA